MPLKEDNISTHFFLIANGHHDKIKLKDFFAAFLMTSIWALPMALFIFWLWLNN